MSSVISAFKSAVEKTMAKRYKSYSPVSVLFAIRKLSKKLVSNRFVNHLEKCSLFSDFQYDFGSP